MSSLRKLRRSIAHANMAREGIRQTNKSRQFFGQTVQSFFAQNWREYAEKPPQTCRASAGGRNKRRERG